MMLIYKKIQLTFNRCYFTEFEKSIYCTKFGLIYFCTITLNEVYDVLSIHCLMSCFRNENAVKLPLFIISNRKSTIFIFNIIILIQFYCIFLEIPSICQKKIPESLRFKPLEMFCLLTKKKITFIIKTRKQMRCIQRKILKQAKIMRAKMKYPVSRKCRNSFIQYKVSNSKLNSNLVQNFKDIDDILKNILSDLLCYV